MQGNTVRLRLQLRVWRRCSLFDYVFTCCDIWGIACMVTVYYVDRRLYLLQAMYAYGLNGFLITLSQTEKRILRMEAHLMLASSPNTVTVIASWKVRIVMSEKNWVHLGPWLKTAVHPDDMPNLRDEARSWRLQIVTLSAESVNKGQRTLCLGPAICPVLIEQ